MTSKKDSIFFLHVFDADPIQAKHHCKKRTTRGIGLQSNRHSLWGYVREITVKIIVIREAPSWE